MNNLQFKGVIEYGSGENKLTIAGDKHSYIPGDINSMLNCVEEIQQEIDDIYVRFASIKFDSARVQIERTDGTVIDYIDPNAFQTTCEVIHKMLIV